MNSSRLLHTKIRQDFGILFFNGKQIMASRAIVRDHLPVRAGVAAVVTAEAARKIVVPEVIWMHAPGHLHFRENPGIWREEMPNAHCVYGRREDCWEA